ncbi:HAD-IA family hydrolase [Nocardia sp. 2]|uniref:HAD-IA family hydrolase n=1 Tax=Nocardia acididurans TaxID=2802282 RepID=A0ABS1M7H3_9NOCA|nr:HAD-IA family hydrolase [Nocardia acididurans]MBL1076592.1 HAD-IA family hydrolase [Nocardia acididurans]
MTVIATLVARGLLLDMDGTLVNSDAVVERLWGQWAAEQGLDVNAVLAVAHGRQGWATMAQFLPERPVEINHAENARMLEEETVSVDGVVPVDGAQAFMASVAHLPHALVTSANTALAEVRMRAAGLALPVKRITAESVSVSKPDPEGFLKGAAELGVAPADCVVFEDSEAGIAAGKAAGAMVVGVGPRAAAFAPTVHVPDLTRITVEPLAEGAIAIHVLD